MEIQTGWRWQAHLQSKIPMKNLDEESENCWLDTLRKKFFDKRFK